MVKQYIKIIADQYKPMQFIRSYNNNLIDKDRYSSRKKEYDSLESEVFEDISKIIIHTESHRYEFTDKDIDKVVESYNYFTIIPKSGFNQTITIIKYNLVEKIEMVVDTILNLKSDR